MEPNNRLDQIRQHFCNLKECHQWCFTHFLGSLGLSGQYTEADRLKLEEKILPAVENEYKLLAKLGVSYEFSAALFLFGPLVTQNLIGQFQSGSTEPITSPVQPANPVLATQMTL